MDISICIVTYNSASMICQCLESIYGHEHAFSFEVFVVDNHSMDGTVTNVQARYPQIQVIRNRRNLGYAKANNQGIARSSGRYVLILNPDILVMRGSLETLLSYMDRNPDVGVAGCRLLYPNGELQLSCRRFPTLATFLLRGSRVGDMFPRLPLMQDYLLQRENHEEDLDVDWCLGSCLMVRREALDQVGPLDGNYFLYYEDIDLCYRMKQHRWKVRYVASAEMIHHYHRLSASVLPNRFTMYHLKSALYFFWKFRKHRGAATLR